MLWPLIPRNPGIGWPLSSQTAAPAPTTALARPLRRAPLQRGGREARGRDRRGAKGAFRGSLGVIRGSVSGASYPTPAGAAPSPARSRYRARPTPPAGAGTGARPQPPALPPSSSPIGLLKRWRRRGHLGHCQRQPAAGGARTGRRAPPAYPSPCHAPTCRPPFSDAFTRPIQTPEGRRGGRGLSPHAGLPRVPHPPLRQHPRSQDRAGAARPAAVRHCHR